MAGQMSSLLVLQVFLPGSADATSFGSQLPRGRKAFAKTVGHVTLGA